MGTMDAAEVNRTGRPATVPTDDEPWVITMPSEPSAHDVALDFMDEYAEVFEKLAK